MKCRRSFLLLSMILSACATTPRGPSTYKGTYFYNFEYAYLTPKGMDERWCVNGDMSSAELPKDWGTADVVVQGVVGPVGHYGNLGACRRVINVMKVLQISNKRGLSDK